MNLYCYFIDFDCYFIDFDCFSMQREDCDCERYGFPMLSGLPEPITFFFKPRSLLSILGRSDSEWSWLDFNVYHVSLILIASIFITISIYSYRYFTDRLRMTLQKNANS